MMVAIEQDGLEGRDKLIAGGAMLAAAMLAFVAWYLPGVPGIAVLLPMLWAMAPGRVSAGGVVGIYFAVGTAPWAVSVASMMPGLTGEVTGVGLVAAYALIQATVWAFLWPREGLVVAPAWRTMAAMLVTIVPPLGIAAWGHPVHAAGALFPGAGLVGVALLVLMTMMMAVGGALVRDGRTQPAVALSVVLAGLIITGPLLDRRSVVEGWVGMETYQGKSFRLGTAHFGPGFEAALEQHRKNDERAIHAVERVAFMNPTPRLIVAPEGAANIWQGGSSWLWRKRIDNIHRLRPVTVLTSGDWIEGSIQQPRARFAAIVLEPSGSEDVIFARQPAPIFGWAPWRARGDYIEADWTARSIIKAAGKDIMVSVCYENTLPALYILSALEGRFDGIAAIANQWHASRWAAEAQERHAAQWAQLFGVPLIAASNSRPSLE